MTNFGKVKNFVKVHVNDQEHVLTLKHPMNISEVILGNLGRSTSSHAVPLKPPSGQVVAVPIGNNTDVYMYIVINQIWVCFNIT